MQVSDAVKQSIPFSYVFFEASSTDGQSHDIQVYCDIDAGEECRTCEQDAFSLFVICSEWVSGNRSATVTWSTASTASSIYHQVQLQTPSQFQENTDQAQDATLYFATSSVSLVFSVSAFSVPKPLAESARQFHHK